MNKNHDVFLNSNICIQPDRLFRLYLILALLQESWLPTLRNLVAQINDSFSRNFQEMAVAGEVSLGIYDWHLVIKLFVLSFLFILIFCFFSDEHDMDFDKYGILIKVKFR